MKEHILPILLGGSLACFDTFLTVLCVFSGAVTAATWTLINADLFRRHNGA